MINMKFSQFCQYLEQIESTTSRLEITSLLAELFDLLTADELRLSVYLLLGRVGPLYENQEFGLAEKTVRSAAVSGLGISLTDFQKAYQTIGDLGQTVFQLKQQSHSLFSSDPDLISVCNKLKQISELTGKGSLIKKKEIVSQMIREFPAISGKYISRLLVGNLRLGFSDMTVLDSLSWLAKGDKSLRPLLEKAYHVRPDLGYIAYLVKQNKFSVIENIEPEVFVPIIMMRAERVKTLADIIDKLGRCLVEPKYDGFRLQIHKQHNKVKMFSRNLEEVSFMYPDLKEAVLKQTKAESLIFEGEAIGFDPKTNTFLPFQETAQRRRKYNIDQVSQEIPLKLFVFELLYLNGKNCIDNKLIDRKAKIKDVVREVDDAVLIIAEDHFVSKTSEIESLFYKYTSEGLEGIMAKKLDGVYKPGAREFNWIKFKASYSKKLNDTIDVVVLGYYYGKGKRSEFGIGAFLVGVYDKILDKFCSIAKIGTGVSDQQWIELKRLFDKNRVSSMPKEYIVDKQIQPDVWIAPKVVIEVAADEVTLSPVHTAGKDEKSKTGSGFALRFPRMIRLRSDKDVVDITTVEEIKQLVKI